MRDPMLKDFLESINQEIPKSIIADILRQKIEKQAPDESEEISEQLAEKIVTGDYDKTTSTIHLKDIEAKGISKLDFNDEDLKELDRRFKNFLESDLYDLIESVIDSSAKEHKKHYKRDWPDLLDWERETTFEFRKRLRERWGNAIDLLKLIHAISIDRLERATAKASKSRAKRNLNKRHALLELHARACHITGEIIVLLEAGYSDGAMARWRTLHEVNSVAMFLMDGDDELSRRYLAHDVIEAHKALEAYLECYQDLGYKPPPKRDESRTRRAYQAALEEFGRNFRNEYGWAAEALNNPNPRFNHIAKAARQAQRRAHYKIASYNVHAGVRGITSKLSILGDSPSPVGPTNAGLDEPGQSAVISLCMINLVLWPKNLKLFDQIELRVLAALRDECVDAFVKAGRKLKRDHKKIIQHWQSD